MTDNSLGQEGCLLTLDTPLGKDRLIPIRLTGWEALSEGFAFDLDMISTDGALSPDALLGRQVTVGIKRGDGSHRSINAVVTRFSAGPRDDRVFRYRAELKPWTWLLELCSDCRIFQNLSVGQIIQEVCKSRGFTDLKLDLKRVHGKLDYVVQYQETDLAFLSRLIEQHGLFSFFEHEADRHWLIISDDADGYRRTPGLEANAVTVAPDGLSSWQHTDLFVEAGIEQKLITGGFAVEDYNFETSTTDLLATVKGGGGRIERFVYATGHQVKADGQAAARLLMESEEAIQAVLTAEGRCRSLQPGHTFTLKGFHRADANGAYVVRKIHHDVSHDDYRNKVEAIPAQTSYRARRQTPKPVIAGTQTARVTGPKGKEIWTDKHGRIKVQFHWDRQGKVDDKTSCWVRVVQGWGGKQWGSFFLPRVGMEVVVSFLDGDPDRPLVTGCVYNGQQKPPYALPAHQTRSTIKSASTPNATGANELRFEDKKDNEEIYLHAQKDLLTEVERNRTTRLVEGDDLLEVKKGDRSSKIAKGNETHEVAGTRTLTVGKAETHNDKAGFTHNVKGDYTLKVKGSLTIDVGGAINVKSAKSITLKSSLATTVKAGTAITQKAGTAFATEAGTSMRQKAALSIETKAGMSIKTSAGAGIEQKAGGSLKSQAGGMVQTKAAGMMQAKAGGIHQAEAGAMMIVRGALVKIN
ncbi:MAG: type VI secretion system Vgr family protein [Geminicoccaceae bacterium]